MNRKLVLAMALTIILMGILVVTFKVQTVEAIGAIYIRADGSVEGTDKISTVDNVTYTFTDNIYDEIVVNRSNIIIDGNGYTLNGTGTGQYVGLTVEYVDSEADDNVTIQNMNIIGFDVGIGLVSTEGNKILGNTIANNGDGIWLGEAWDNTVSGNIITNNTNGIVLSTVFNTVFSQNNITKNTVGIVLFFGSDNEFYHNYFVDNTNQTSVDPDNPNTWDDGYPSGGNYWSDFEERYPGVGDIYSGPGQNETGSDGFWDGPYEIDENNQDNYPIVPEFPTFFMLPIFMTITLLVAITYRKRSPTGLTSEC